MFKRISTLVCAIACLAVLAGSQAPAKAAPQPQSVLVSAVAGTDLYVWARASTIYQGGFVNIASSTTGKGRFSGTQTGLWASVDLYGNVHVTVFASGVAFDALGRTSPAKARLDITQTHDGKFTMGAGVAPMSVSSANLNASPSVEYGVWNGAIVIR